MKISSNFAPCKSMPNSPVGSPPKRSPAVIYAILGCGHATCALRLCIVRFLCMAVPPGIFYSYTCAPPPMFPVLKVNNTLPWALLLHLCFTCWFMGTESLKSEFITESISQVQPYGEVIAAYKESYGIFVSFPRHCCVSHMELLSEPLLQLC